MVQTTFPTVALANMTIALSDKTIERANVIAERTGSLEIGLAKALLIEQLESKLADNQLCRHVSSSPLPLVRGALRLARPENAQLQRYIAQ